MSAKRARSVGRSRNEVPVWVKPVLCMCCDVRSTAARQMPLAMAAVPIENQGSTTCSMVFAPSPCALISPQGEGANTMLQVVLPWFAIGTAAMANGICRAAVDRTSQHMQSTGFEHTGTSLRDLPTLRARLADMSVRVSQSRALLGYALNVIDSGSEAAPLYVLQSRLSSIEAATDVTDLAMKACGGAAFSKQVGVERFFRDARAGWVMAPTADHLRDFVGRALTGLPLF